MKTRNFTVTPMRNPVI